MEIPNQKKGGTKMKKVIGIFLLASLVLISPGFHWKDTSGYGPGSAAAAETFKARLATSWPSVHESAKACHRFAEEVKKASKGRLEITVFDSGTLFGSKDWLGAVSAGSVEFGASFMSTAETMSRDLSAAVVPFAFGDYNSIHRFFSENKVGEAVMSAFEKKVGVKEIFFVANGHFTIWSAKPIHSLDDLKGFKARTTSPALSNYLKALGMNPIALPSEEVYQALQSGMIEAYISNYVGPKSFSYTDFSKVIIEPSFGLSLGLGLVNKRFFDKLPKDLQNVVIKVGEKTFQETISLTDRKEAEVVKEFTGKMGGRIYTMTPSELAHAKQLVKKEVAPKMAEQWKNPQLWDEIQERLK